jgi:predicted NBD/HSP70 family sugar kinase
MPMDRPMDRQPLGQRSETVRRANLSSIARQLHLHGPLSRSALVVRTGLTRSAIRGLIGELVGAGLAWEERGEPIGVPGRPSPLVRPNEDGAVVLALDVTVDSLAAAAVGFGGTVHELTRIDRPRRRLSLDRTVRDLVALVEPMRGRGRIIGVGVSVAAVVRRSDGLVRMAPNLGWRDVPLGERLAVALGLDVPVSVANEADLGVLAEVRRGAAIGVDDVLYISGEVGVGGGVIVDGRPLAGVAGYGGEVGHMMVNPTGTACGCGSVGCWETEIGEPSLLARAGRSAIGGRAEVEAVLAAADAGEAQALAALEAVGGWLGRGLSALVNSFNPRLVVLGGLFGRIHPYVAATVDGGLDRHALPPSRELVRVVPAALGLNASIIGAAELAFEPLLRDPAWWIGPGHGLVELASA